MASNLLLTTWLPLLQLNPRRGGSGGGFEEERKVICLDDNVYSVLDEHGKVSMVAIFTRNPIERKMAVETKSALRKAIPDLTFLFSSDGAFIDYNYHEGDDPLVQPRNFLGRKAGKILSFDLADLIWGRSMRDCPATLCEPTSMRHRTE